MGIRSWTEAYRDDQLPDLVGGHTSILFGRSLRGYSRPRSPDGAEAPASVKQPDGRGDGQNPTSGSPRQPKRRT